MHIDLASGAGESDADEPPSRWRTGNLELVDQADHGVVLPS